jgi:hypothetical protein
MKSIDITYAGRTVALPDLSAYGKFYRKLVAGSWEPRTFEVLARNIDQDTVCLDWCHAVLGKQNCQTRDCS